TRSKRDWSSDVCSSDLQNSALRIPDRRSRKKLIVDRYRRKLLHHRAGLFPSPRCRGECTQRPVSEQSCSIPSSTAACLVAPPPMYQDQIPARYTASVPAWHPAAGSPPSAAPGTRSNAATLSIRPGRRPKSFCTVGTRGQRPLLWKKPGCCSRSNFRRSRKRPRREWTESHVTQACDSLLQI